MFSLSLYQFAGIKEKKLDLALSSIIIWENGSGKTKILEALIFLMNGIPIRERSARDYITWDWEQKRPSGSYGISLTFRSGLLDEVFALEMQNSKLAYFHQGQSISRQKYLDLMPCRALLFHPAEMNIVYGSPSLRRQYMDTTLQISTREAHRIIREYEQSLKERNSLLKLLRNWSPRIADLDVWDEIYTDRSMALMQIRQSLLQDWQPNPWELSDLLGKNLAWLRLEGVGVSFDSLDRAAFARQLTSNREKDIIVGHTTYGPQYDDFDFLIGSWDSPVSTRDFLSRGENKTLLLYLKSRQMQHIQKKRPDKWLILLFDDIFAELDTPHVWRVMALHKSFPTVYTSAQRESIPSTLSDTSLSINI